jgi:hypothetical protein
MRPIQRQTTGRMAASTDDEERYLYLFNCPCFLILYIVMKKNNDNENIEH